jgi:hypothetical protein
MGPYTDNPRSVLESASGRALRELTGHTGCGLGGGLSKHKGTLLKLNDLRTAHSSGIGRAAQWFPRASNAYRFSFACTH